MTCYFRALGRDFDVDAFLRRSELAADDVFHRGERQFPESTRITRRHRYSGFTTLVGSRRSWKLESQVRAAQRFLDSNMAEVRRLSRASGIESLRLDFGVAANLEAAAQFFPLPRNLVALAARGGVELEVSVYNVEDDTPLPNKRLQRSGSQTPRRRRARRTAGR